MRSIPNIGNSLIISHLTSRRVGYAYCGGKQHIRILRWANCLEFGHKPAACSNPTICGNCHGSHATQACPNDNIYKCVNCSRRKAVIPSLDDNHETFSGDCPMKKLSFTQLNCCKSPHAARQLSEVAHQSDFLIISEPPLVRNHPKYLGPNFVVLSGPDPSAVIAVKKNLARNTIFMGNLSDNFVCTVALDMGNSTLYLSSVYLKPSWSITQFETELEFLGKVINGLPRSKHLLAGDFNSWNTAWGSRKSNKRGSLLLNFFSSFGYTVFNSGKRPTFQRGSHVSAIDLSVASSELLPHTSNWTVKQNLTSLSDHNLIH